MIRLPLVPFRVNNYSPIASIRLRIILQKFFQQNDWYTSNFRAQYFVPLKIIFDARRMNHRNAHEFFFRPVEDSLMSFFRIRTKLKFLKFQDLLINSDGNISNRIYHRHYKCYRIHFKDLDQTWQKGNYWLKTQVSLTRFLQ